MSRVLNLKGRYYRTIPMESAGYTEEALDLDAAQTAFVSLHCWDIGCPGGPEADPQYCVGMGHRVCLDEAYRVMHDVVRPAMDAARAAGLAVYHVQAESIAANYPKWFTCDADPPPAGTGDPAPEAIPGHRDAVLFRSHGQDYMTRSGLAHMDIAEVVAALPDEPVVHQTSQFDRMLRRQGIVNLIYTGFATDMCILNAPGGVGPMFSLGYRVLLIREATLGVEQPDTIDDRIATRWGMRFIETHWGDTIGFDDFMAACARLGCRATPLPVREREG
ncbi:MAG: isochorismatase family protein [Armatimonadota bacterium]|nr:MAG: isochorismatase family protein [Armatimonadota bacterium]